MAADAAGSSATDPVFLVQSLDGVSDELLLDGAEGRHAATVRRLGVGQSLQISDGNGAALAGRVAEVLGESLRVAVESWLDVPLPQPQIVVVQALPKGDRGELAVGLMTELGADRIVPWQAHRCITQWREARGSKHLERWRNAAREASKQSRRLRTTRVSDLATTRDVCALLTESDLAIVLHERAVGGFSTLELPPKGQVAVVIGPEGGLTDGELLALRAAGGNPVRLGEGILRTSTAGAAILSALAAGLGRWG